MENAAFAAGAEGEMENAAVAAGAGMAPTPVALPGVICRVLLIEEDPSYLATLTQMLQNRGYPGTRIDPVRSPAGYLPPARRSHMFARMCAVTAKASPEEGLRALRDNPEEFDLVMTVAHTQGTGIDGFELLKKARESYPVIRKSCVICMSPCLCLY
jgi:CheY-like chemotaxis protein